MLQEHNNYIFSQNQLYFLYTNHKINAPEDIVIAFLFFKKLVMPHYMKISRNFIRGGVEISSLVVDIC